MRFSISAAARSDLPEILAIYNEVIRNTTAVYSDEDVTLANREAWFDAKIEHGFPVLVASDESGVLGFGTFGEFRAWPCYRYSVEHSVHVRADCRRRGIGRELVLALLERAAGMQKHVMIAGIDADNAVSIRASRESRLHGGGPFPRGGVQVRAMARLEVPATAHLISWPCGKSNTDRNRKGRRNASRRRLGGISDRDGLRSWSQCCQSGRGAQDIRSQRPSRGSSCDRAPG